MAEAASKAGEGCAGRFVKESSIVFVALIITAVVGLAFRMFLARTLGMAEYGLFYSVLALVLIVGTFRDLGLGQTVVRYLPKFAVEKRHDELKTTITIYATVQILYSLFAGLILFVLSDRIAITIFGTAEASLVIKLLSGWFFFEAVYYTFRTVFLGFREVTPHSLLGFFEIVLPFVSMLCLIGVFGPSAATVGLAYLIGLGGAVLIALGLFLKKHSDILRAKFEASKPLLKELFVFTSPLLIGGIMSIILGQANTLLLATLRSSSEAGLYQVAHPAADLLVYFPMAIGIVLFPMTSELWAKKERVLLGNAMRAIIKFSFVFIVPIAFILLAFPDVVINLLFGPEYMAASLALRILVLNVVVGTILVVPKKVMLGIGKSATYVIVVGVRGGLALILGIILIPFYGVSGAAVAILFSSLVALLLSVYLARRYIKFTVPSSSLAKAVVGGVLTLLLVSVLKAVVDLPLFLELFVAIVPSLLFYAMWVLFTRTLERSDLLLLKNAVPVPKWVLRIAKKFIR